MCGSRKYPYPPPPPHGRSLEIPRGRGGSKRGFKERTWYLHSMKRTYFFEISVNSNSEATYPRNCNIFSRKLIKRSRTFINEDIILVTLKWSFEETCLHSRCPNHLWRSRKYNSTLSATLFSFQMLRSHLDSYNQVNCHLLSKKQYVISRGIFENNGNSGGGGGPRQPPWKGNSWGEGGCKTENLPWGGEMDIFWNYTIKTEFVTGPRVQRQGDLFRKPVEPLNKFQNCDFGSGQNNITSLFANHCNFSIHLFII